MKILVTGGRDYADSARVDEALDAVHAATPIAQLIHGDARGADRLAADWARRRGIPVDPRRADWNDIDVPGARIRFRPGSNRPYNAAAGTRRNIEMLETEPDLVVAFPGGNGTAHCCREALKRNIAVLEVEA